jgi:hypothetical protein
VESDIAAAITFEKLNAALGKQFRRRNYVGRLRVAARGDDWRVFEEEKNVANLIFFAQSD